MQVQVLLPLSRDALRGRLATLLCTYRAEGAPGGRRDRPPVPCLRITGERGQLPASRSDGFRFGGELETFDRSHFVELLSGGFQLDSPARAVICDGM